MVSGTTFLWGIHIFSVGLAYIAKKGYQKSLFKYSFSNFDTLYGEVKWTTMSQKVVLYMRFEPL